ncbi:hypothetical protein GCM10027290_53720 [Micromonospora sonneratiae]|uniref:LPXTG-motif cell wall anchor domain-containing protein n=1 Tax=Micromonospora sonneratiae TaxID=1184706 RepID=A0ABW3YFE9_9ACTN
MKSDNRRRTATRLGVAAIAAFSLGVAAAPAYADPSDPPSFSGSMRDYLISTGSTGKTGTFDTFRYQATNPKVVFDLTDMTGVAKVTFPSDCQVAGGKTTCLVDKVGELIRFTMTPVAGAKAGQKGTIEYTTSADNVAAETSSATVTLTGSGVDLVALDQVESRDPVKPGTEVEVPITFYNAGDRTSPGVELGISFTHGMVPEQYENCRYGTDEENPALTFARCVLEEEILPGIEYGIEAPFEARLGADAVGIERADYAVWPIGEGPAVSNKAKLTKGNGPRLTLKAKGKHAAARTARDLDQQDNYGYYHLLNVQNSLDLAAVGGNLSGAVGDVVSLDLGMTNRGAGALKGRGEFLFGFMVPTGATVTEVPAHCRSITKQADGGWRWENGRPGTPGYACAHPDPILKPGASHLLTFKLKITSLTGTAGQVSVGDPSFDPEFAWKDDNNANNVAEVTVGANGGGGGGLPVTGAKAGLLAGGGAVLLAAGVAFFLMTRRRRLVLVAGDDEKLSA